LRVPALPAAPEPAPERVGAAGADATLGSGTAGCNRLRRLRSLHRAPLNPAGRFVQRKPGVLPPASVHSKPFPTLHPYNPELLASHPSLPPEAQPWETERVDRRTPWRFAVISRAEPSAPVGRAHRSEERRVGK